MTLKSHGHSGKKLRFISGRTNLFKFLVGKAEARADDELLLSMQGEAAEVINVDRLVHRLSLGLLGVVRVLRRPGLRCHLQTKKGKIRSEKNKVRYDQRKTRMRRPNSEEVTCKGSPSRLRPLEERHRRGAD